MEYTRDRHPNVPVTTSCTVENRDAVLDLLHPWIQGIIPPGSGVDISRESLMNVPARTIGSTEQTHWLCFALEGWDYLDVMLVDRVKFNVPSDVKLQLYTEYLAENNLEVMDAEVHTKYLALEQQFITECEEYLAAIDEQAPLNAIRELKDKGQHSPQVPDPLSQDPPL